MIERLRVERLPSASSGLEPVESNRVEAASTVNSELSPCDVFLHFDFLENLPFKNPTAANSAVGGLKMV